MTTTSASLPRLDLLLEDVVRLFEREVAEGLGECTRGPEIERYVCPVPRSLAREFHARRRKTCRLSLRGMFAAVRAESVGEDDVRAAREVSSVHGKHPLGRREIEAFGRDACGQSRTLQLRAEASVKQEETLLCECEKVFHCSFPLPAHSDDGGHRLLRGHEIVRAYEDAQSSAHIQQAHEIGLLFEGEIGVAAGEPARRPAALRVAYLIRKVVRHTLDEGDGGGVHHDAEGGIFPHEPRDEPVHPETQRARDDIDGIAPRKMASDRAPAEGDARALQRHAVGLQPETRLCGAHVRRGKGKLRRTIQPVEVGWRKLLPAEPEITQRFCAVDVHFFFSELSLSRKGRTFSVMRRAT